MSEVGQLLSLEYLQPALVLVTTIVAFASLVAEPPLGEALTVHFETIYFGTLAALGLVLAGRQVHLGYGAQDMLIIGKLVVFLDEQVEEILSRTKFEGLLLHLRLSDELEGAG